MKLIWPLVEIVDDSDVETVVFSVVWILDIWVKAVVEVCSDDDICFVDSEVVVFIDKGEPKVQNYLSVIIAQNVILYYC